MYKQVWFIFFEKAGYYYFWPYYFLPYYFLMWWYGFLHFLVVFIWTEYCVELEG